MSDELLLPQETADFLRIEPRTLADWRYRGTGPTYIRYGGRDVRYRRSDVERFVAERARVSTAHDRVLQTA